VSAVLLFEIIGRTPSARGAAAASIALSLSPVLLVTSGYHGDIESVFVVFALLSLCLLAGRNSALMAGLAGIAFAASLGTAIVAIVLLPVLLLIAARAGWRCLTNFLGGTAVVLGLL
jgi:Gpi18-like mannosyltransferase